MLKDTDFCHLEEIFLISTEDVAIKTGLDALKAAS